MFYFVEQERVIALVRQTDYSKGRLSESLRVFRGGSARSSDPLLRMIESLADQMDDVAQADDLALIGQELAHLYAARWAFLRWVQDGRDDEGQRDAQEADQAASAVPPARFLKAWSDSTARVIQLLRARRDLVGQGKGEAIRGLDEALDLLAATYPALADDPPTTQPLPGFE